MAQDGADRHPARRCSRLASLAADHQKERRLPHADRDQAGAHDAGQIPGHHHLVSTSNVKEAGETHLDIGYILAGSPIPESLQIKLYPSEHVSPGA